MNDVLIVIPVHNEHLALEGSVRRLHGFLDALLPVLLADPDRRQREHRRHARRSRAGSPTNSIASMRSGWRRRDVGARCGQPGHRPMRACSATWTSTSRRISRRCCPSSRRSSPGTATSRSGRASRAARTSSAAFGASSSPGRTTACCDSRCARASATRSAASRPSARDVATALLPQIADEEWFFDTELLVLAQRSGLRIHEVPVDWVEDSDSRVQVASTALADLRGVMRLLLHRRSSTTPTLLSPQHPMLAP